MENIFSTRERLEILKAVIFRKTDIRVNAIAQELNLSKGLVSKYLDILVKEGISSKVDGKFIINDSSLVKGIRILLNIRDLDPALFRKYDFVKSAGLYGNCAKGENTDATDIDLWLKTDDSAEECVSELSNELNRRVRNIKILVLTDRKLEQLKKEDALFYNSLAFSSIIIYPGSAASRIQ